MNLNEFCFYLIQRRFYSLTPVVFINKKRPVSYTIHYFNDIVAGFFESNKYLVA